MKGKAYHSDHAKQVMEVAINELETLVKQRTALTIKVKAVKRTVKGLASLFGEEIAGGLRLKCIGPASHSPKAVGNQNSPEVHPLSGSDSEMHKPKLERACRIALLESEEPASAGQIYDRINRRRSYQLGRYKHPLVRVIATLDTLVKEGEALTVIVGDCRCWQWNTGKTDLTKASSGLQSHPPIHHDPRSL